jgi:hypothetical protein
MKRVYLKKDHKYWSMKKINKYSMHLWYFIALSMALITSWAVINRQVNKNPLVSPLTGNLVTPVHASEIPKEQTRWYRLYKFVRWVESNDGTKGLAVTCKSKGMYNDIGFLPVKGFCFKTIEEQELTFANWVNRKYNNGLTENQLLCLYNEGVARDNCPYINNDLKNAN